MPRTLQAGVDRYAIRVFVRVPPQLGRWTAGWATVQCTLPLGSMVTSSYFERTPTTNRPNGDHDASVYGPSSRFDPSSCTTQGPLDELTSNRPGAGSENSSRCAF